MKDNDQWLLTRRLKSLQHDTLQPETGQHMEYAGNVTQETNEPNNCYHYMHIWLVEAVWLQFCEKPIFSYNKGICFILTIMVVETLRMVNPHLNPN